MFQHHAINRNKKQENKGQKNKEHRKFVDPVQHNTLTSGGYQARKKIH
jgi:hypothetical protein